jgi:DNA-binding CsgD family transcriptional regulator
MIATSRFTLAHSSPPSWSPAIADRLLRLARDDARCGRERDCRERVLGAVDIAARLRLPAVAIDGFAILGLLELGLGNLDGADRRFHAGAVMIDTLDLAQVDSLSFGADHVEVLIALGERRQAQWASDREQRNAAAGGPCRRASAARCRALLADATSFESAFEAAIVLCAATEDAFEVARAQLCFGQRLHRERRQCDAREQLAPALALFKQLGSAPWAARARRELDATAPTARRRIPDTADELTKRELEVATLIAGGATVREVADRLVVSHKTIEAHLGRIYTKLAVHNRAQLVHALATRLAEDAGESRAA